MSELEMALRKEGLWDIVARGCAETGLDVGDYLRSVLLPTQENSGIKKVMGEHSIKVLEEGKNKRQKRFAELLKSYPLDFGKTAAAMRAAGIDPDISPEEAYELCHDEF